MYTLCTHTWSHWWPDALCEDRTHTHAALYVCYTKPRVYFTASTNTRDAADWFPNISKAVPVNNGSLILQDSAGRLFRCGSEQRVGLSASSSSSAEEVDVRFIFMPLCQRRQRPEAIFVTSWRFWERYITPYLSDGWRERSGNLVPLWLKDQLIPFQSFVYRYARIHWLITVKISQDALKG